MNDPEFERASTARVLGYSAIGVAWIVAGAVCIYTQAAGLLDWTPFWRIASALSGLMVIAIGMNTIRAIPPQKL